MNSNDLLDIIGEARDTYVLEARKTPEHSKHHSVNRILLIAAIAILILALVGCAVAVILNLQDMKLGSKIYTTDTQHHYGGATTPATEVEKDVISLAGFADSPNYKAAKEWYDFEESYDPDLTIRASMTEAEIAPYREYGYGCYTQEMVDKLNEICTKYGLQPQGRSWTASTAADVFAAVGIDSIFRDDAEIDSYLMGYYIADGSFHVEGDTFLTAQDSPWTYTVEYQFSCNMKTTFSDISLNVGNVEDYEQWTHTLPDGTGVLLALSPDKALILAETEELFISVNILNPTVTNWSQGGAEITMDHAALEAFADIFDLRFSPQKPDAEAADQKEAEEAAAYQEKMAQLEQDYYDRIGVASYADRIRYLIENDYFPEKYGYTLLDLDGNGVEELLIGQDGYIKYMYTIVDEETVDLTPMALTGTVYYYLCEDGYVAFAENDYFSNPGISFGKLVGNHFEWELNLEYDTWKYPDHPWRAIEYGSGFREKESTPLSEAEFFESIASHKRVVHDLTPLSKFPQEEPVNRDPDKLYRNMYKGYDEFIIYSGLENEIEGITYTYALLDLDNNGQEELIFDREYVMEIYTMTDGVFNKIISGNDLTICQGNILKKVQYYGTDNYAITYYRVHDGHKTEIIEYLRYDADRDPENPWFRSNDASGFDDTLNPVSEEQFSAVLNTYAPLNVGMKPITDYPIG